MKKVIIKCISNSNLVGRYHIIIFNKYNNKVFDEYTNYCRVELCLETDVYKIIIIPSDIYLSILSTSFIVNDDTRSYNFYFEKNDDSLKITVVLADKNYDNLPIERGKIRLWQDRIQ